MLKNKDKTMTKERQQTKKHRKGRRYVTNNKKPI